MPADIDPVNLDAEWNRIDELLAPVDAELTEQYPGDRAGRQPVHSVYVSAARADSGLVDDWGAQARALLAVHAGHLTGLGADVAAVDAVLASTPIQDLRLDFEDGYGRPDDATEDADARRSGEVLATLARDRRVGRLGIRPKGLEPHERRRAFRTLELVLDAAGGVPDGFVFTVPKIRSDAQVPAVVALSEALERAHGLPERSLGFELQVETPQIVLGADGTTGLSRAIRRA
ncbi:MAG: aldolase, partial [Gordonia sp. (in: high G+C Gram-positive bacteria)]